MPARRLVGGPPQEVVAEPAFLGRRVAPAVDHGGPVAAEELLPQQRASRSTAARVRACLTASGWASTSRPGPMPMRANWLEQDGVMRRRRVLGQHRVERLPRPERILAPAAAARRRRGARARRASALAPQAQRGEPVLLPAARAPPAGPRRRRPGSGPGPGSRASARAAVAWTPGRAGRPASPGRRWRSRPASVPVVRCPT